jgi:lysozyme family protein
MNFDSAIKHVLRWEGEYVNDKDDLGGETKYGITKRRYPNLNIADLTVEEAVAIYRRDFYEELNINLLPKHLQYIVFDGCINQGPGWTIKALQKLSGVKADGVIGPLTANAAKDVHLVAMISKRYNRYVFIARYRNNKKFLKGWLNRLEDVSKYAYQL